MMIGVHGATGRLGSMICEMDANTTAIHRDTSPPDIPVIIDVTSADGVKSLIPRLSKQALLVGATGDLPWDDLVNYSQRAPVAVVPNFSVGPHYSST